MVATIIDSVSMNMPSIEIEHDQQQQQLHAAEAKTRHPLGQGLADAGEAEREIENEGAEHDEQDHARRLGAGNEAGLQQRQR